MTTKWMYPRPDLKWYRDVRPFHPAQNIWRAKDIVDGEEVVIKGPVSNESPALLRQEYSNVERIHYTYGQRSGVMDANAPRIVPFLHDLVEAPGGPYLVSPYVPDTGRVVRNPERKLDDVLRFGIVASEALMLTHQAGISHLDMKPSNWVDTTTDEQVDGLLIDFGSSQSQEVVLNYASGTPAYASPLQLLGKQDCRADVFSLGVTLYELFTGKNPFPIPAEFSDDELPEVLSFRVAAIIDSHTNNRRSLYDALKGRLSSDFRAVAVATFDPDPDKRPSTREVHAACTAELLSKTGSYDMRPSTKTAVVTEPYASLTAPTIPPTLDRQR